MKTILKLQEVTDILTKQTEDGREYIRVTFNVIDENNIQNKAKISMSEAQWEDLRTAMNVILISEDEIETKTPITIEFDTNGETKSKNPKPLMENKIGKFKTYPFNYLELNVGVLIENKIVNKEVFKKDYGKFFR